MMAKLTRKPSVFCPMPTACVAAILLACTATLESFSWIWLTVVRPSLSSAWLAQFGKAAMICWKYAPMLSSPVLRF
ncbi:hypothetical protein D3C72_2372790 [compost metagenome]